jgi:hypothetical protein
LGYPNFENPNFYKFKVKIVKNCNQLKEYEYLFNVASNQKEMALTVYQANTTPKQPRNGKLLFLMNGKASVSYKFSIPNDWAQSELELRIALTQSGQVIKNNVFPPVIF